MHFVSISIIVVTSTPAQVGRSHGMPALGRSQDVPVVSCDTYESNVSLSCMFF